MVKYAITYLSIIFHPSQTIDNDRKIDLTLPNQIQPYTTNVLLSKPCLAKVKDYSTMVH